MRYIVLVLSLLQLICIATSSVDNQLLERFKRAHRVKRIIGGDDISKGDYPWLCHIYGKIPASTVWGIPTSYKIFYCGCTIVDRKWVITAAHCFSPKDDDNSIVKAKILNPKYWHIKAGEVIREHSLWEKLVGKVCGWFGRSECEIYKEHADSIVIHPNYSPDAKFWPNDIAMVKLRKNLPLNDARGDMAALRLPQHEIQDWPKPGSNCTVKGWGCTHAGGSVTDIAKAVVLPINTPEECDKIYGNLGNKRLCAGPRFESKGICPGDSGGPLSCTDESGYWHMVGIASFTSGSRPGQIPGVFTRVSEYITWINNVIN